VKTPLWVRNVLCLCNALGGKITAEQIANVAAMRPRPRFADDRTILVSDLKRRREIQVEIVGSTTADNGRSVKLYRITRRRAG
jgi:hypothetical protein